MFLINVYPFLPIFNPLTYKIKDYLYPYAKDGMRVIVPFRNKKIMGIIYGKPEEKIEEEKIKEVSCLLDESPILNENLIKLCIELSKYYFVPFGEAIKLLFPPKYLKLREKEFVLSLKGSLEGSEELLNVMKKPKNLSFFQGSKENFEKFLIFKERGWIEEKKDFFKRDFFLTYYYLPEIPFEILEKKVKRSKKKLEVLKVLKEEGRPLLFSQIRKKILVEESFLRKMHKENLILMHFEEKEPFYRTHWIPEKNKEPLHNLTESQKKIYEEIKRQIYSGNFKVFLLYGVTDSGKSEIYLHLVDYILKGNGKALILVPEIALTPFLGTRAINLWGERVGIYHSNLTPYERNEVFRKVLEDKIDLVIGTRSALFLPLKNLKLIIVDEEQDASYKQEELPKYNARDMAILRGSIEGLCVLLSSATPSIESMANCEKGKYKILKLKERIFQRPLPEIKIIDTKKEEIMSHDHGWVIFTKKFLDNLKKHINNGNQAILLIQRRGYAPIYMCRVCGNSFLCPNCSLGLTVHKRKNKLICHWCDIEKEIPSKCPKCNGEVLESIGIATERVFEELKKFFPDTPCGILDRDTISKRENLRKLLFDFEQKKIKILVGTQLVAKGHHFPSVTFIGIINADFLLKFPDFRGPERLFSLIVQVSGRAGRGDTPGEVYIQTENPEHYAIKLAVNQDFEEFYKKEINYRRLFNYPPFSSLALLTIHSKNLSNVLKTSEEIKEKIKKIEKEGIEIKGPSPAPFKKLKREYRYQILFKAKSKKIIHNFLINLKNYFLKKSIILDIDPLNFL